MDAMRVSQQAFGAPSRVQYVRMTRSVRDAARLLAQADIDALVVIDGKRDDEGTIIGIITERDIFRAMATGGLEILDGLVWMLARNDFASVDHASSSAERLGTFCAHKADHVAVMDGFALRSVQSIWECVTAAPSPRQP